MRIGVIGAGNVGGTLGRRWAELGHDVTFGLHHEPDDELRATIAAVTAAGRRLRAASVRDAAAGADAVALTVPWGAVGDALRAAGPLDGTVLLDCTNSLKAGLSLDVGPGGESGGERVAALAPRARVVKIFNTTGYNNMADPAYGGEPTVMLYCGDDAEAKGLARRLATELGFDAVDAGGLERARLLEALALLWISLAVGGMGREIAFKLARR